MSTGTIPIQPRLPPQHPEWSQRQPPGVIAQGSWTCRPSSRVCARWRGGEVCSCCPCWTRLDPTRTASTRSYWLPKTNTFPSRPRPRALLGSHAWYETSKSICGHSPSNCVIGQCHLPSGCKTSRSVRHRIGKKQMA